MFSVDGEVYDEDSGEWKSKKKSEVPPQVAYWKHRSHSLTRRLKKDSEIELRRDIAR